MSGCAEHGCVLPGRFRPVASLLPQKHWGEGESRAVLAPCYCTIHRDSVTLDKLMVPGARKHLDIQFIRDGKAPPDWSTAQLLWLEIDPRDGRELMPLDELARSGELGV